MGRSGDGFAFVVDENLGRRIPTGMRGFGESVRFLVDEFGLGVADVDWLPQVGKRGWIVITRDQQMLHQPAERQAILDNDVGVFWLDGGRLPRCQLIQQLVRSWPQIKETAKRLSGAFWYRVSPTGSTIRQVDLAASSQGQSPVT